MNKLIFMSKELKDRIKTLAAEVGYSACGITDTSPFIEYRDAVEKMMIRFPDQADSYERMLGRVDPAKKRPWAKSIVVCIRRYGKYDLPDRVGDNIGRNYLCDNRRHAGCPDHGMPARMKQGLIELGMRTSKGGVPDRWVGARSGVTAFGRNCFAYSEHGSWINIETWLVDAELPVDEPEQKSICPEGCDLCIKACPTGALCEPFVMRMDRCVAYLTYDSPDDVPENLEEKMGPWIYGCDICQQVCPLNKGKWEALEKAEWLEKYRDHLTPQALAEMDQETYENIVHPLLWYIPKTRLDVWHRNARRAQEYEISQLIR
ncbi:MAG: epoxyqueuosine reductase [Kiritimatiellae bacterium]|nr:epoxyqueuosine reductase [Kiritimatiellia bacterium]